MVDPAHTASEDRGPQQPAIDRRAGELLQAARDDLARRVDAAFACVLVVSWLAAIGVALWHADPDFSLVWSATVVGSVLVAVPLLLVLLRPGWTATRHALVVSQMTLAGLVVHASGGGQTGALVYLCLVGIAAWRDPLVIASASLVTMADQAVRQSFGVPASVLPWGALEHAGWIIGLDVILLLACVRGRREMATAARSQATLEYLQAHVDRTVAAATGPLRASEARFRALCNATPMALFETDAAGRFIFVNTTWESVTGRPAASALGDGWHLALSPELREPALAAWLRAALQGRDFEATWRLAPCCGGEERWSTWHATARHAGDGTFLGHVGTVEVQASRPAVDDPRRARDADDCTCDSEVPAPRAPGHIAGPAQILVVDDNPVNGSVMLHLLRQLGLRADVVTNGAEAVSASERCDYGLVLMDCQMPVMDGYEATRAIREREERGRRRRIPIVALTANVQPEDRARCAAAGMDDHLAKPISMARLRAALAARAPSLLTRETPPSVATHFSEARRDRDAQRCDDLDAGETERAPAGLAPC